MRHALRHNASREGREQYVQRGETREHTYRMILLDPLLVAEEASRAREKLLFFSGNDWKESLQHPNTKNDFAPNSFLPAKMANAKFITATERDRTILSIFDKALAFHLDTPALVRRESLSFFFPLPVALYIFSPARAASL